MNEVVKCQPRNLTIIIEVEVPGSYHSSSESIAKRAEEAVHREFRECLKTELIGYEMCSGDKKSSFSSDYQMIRELAETEWPKWKIDSYNQNITSEHTKSLSRKLTETQRLGAIIACQTDQYINGTGIEEVLQYLTELSGSEVAKDNYSEFKKKLKDKIADDFRNLGGNA